MDVPKPEPQLSSRVIWAMVIFAALCIGRAAVAQNDNFVSLTDFAALRAKAPFQNRVLMVPMLRAAGNSRLFLRLYNLLFAKTVRSPEDLAVIITNCSSLLLMLPVTVSLRRKFLPPPVTTWLAPLVMLLIVAFTYVVRYEQRYTMPYDFLSMLLFTLGILAIVNRSGWLFLAVLFLGIPNRESAVFLIPMWFWLEASRKSYASAVSFSVAGLAIYFAWRYEVARILKHPAHSVYDFPFRNNLVSLVVPLHWPQLLSVFGFLAIPMWILRQHIRDEKLRNLWLSTIPFFAAALIVGVWRETRIFGELSAMAAVTFAIQLEQLLTVQFQQSP